MTVALLRMCGGALCLVLPTLGSRNRTRSMTSFARKWTANASQVCHSRHEERRHCQARYDETAVCFYKADGAPLPYWSAGFTRSGQIAFVMPEL
jgi:hypothetical protein